MIRNIIFDLGNVLVHVDFAKLKSSLLTAGVNEKDFSRFFSKKIRRNFELGKISASVFMDMAYHELGEIVSKSLLKKLFTDIFDEIPEMKKFLKSLVQKNK